MCSQISKYIQKMYCFLFKGIGLFGVEKQKGNKNTPLKNRDRVTAEILLTFQPFRMVSMSVKCLINILNNSALA